MRAEPTRAEPARAEPARAYLAALLIGAASVWAALPADVLLGGGAFWAAPMTDVAQSLAGHLGYQLDAWRWPLLGADNLFVPHRVTVALTDSNPLFSLAGKIWTRATGHGPVNLLGLWLGLCFLLQPVAAVYALRGTRCRGLVPAVAAAVLAACFPAMLFRIGHVNLCGHFLVLAALGVALRRPAGRRFWLPAAALLCVAVLCHPYLFMLCAAVLAAVPLQAVLDAGRGAWRAVLAYLGCGIVAAALLMLLAGPLGGGDKGFVVYSMNLLSPVWPQISGVLGADLPILDGTGGQYEGYNWLGAGLVPLAVVALLAFRRTTLRRHAGLIAILAGLFLLSLSSRVYAGPVRLLDLGTKPWEDIFGMFRAPGRAFWAVGYAILIAAVAAVARLPRLPAAALLLAAAALQVADTAPLRARIATAMTIGQPETLPPIPANTTRLTAAPYPSCTPDPNARHSAPLLLLAAVRQGIALGDIGVGRAPRWFSCERFWSDATELPLAPGEVRAFFTAPLPRAAALGAPCRIAPGATLCGHNLDPAIGPEADPGAPLPSPSLPLSADAAALPPLLGTGWARDAAGDIWSEGTRASLLLAVPPDAPLVVTLHLRGIAADAGGTRSVAISAGLVTLATIALPDDAATQTRLAIPAAAVASGVLRLAFDIDRPVDPARRGLAAPVRRAGLRLLGLDIARAP